MLVDFYHLAASPLEQVLPRICEKVLAEGERLLVVAEPARLAQLDAQLWNYAPGAFLPHGRSNAPRAEAQPVLLSSAVDPLNGATHVALADGIWRDEALGLRAHFLLLRRRPYRRRARQLARAQRRRARDLPLLETGRRTLGAGALISPRSGPWSLAVARVNAG